MIVNITAEKNVLEIAVSFYSLKKKDFMKVLLMKMDRRVQCLSNETNE